MDPMNYLKVYESIVVRARTRTLVGLTEEHHIWPVSLHGSDAAAGILPRCAPDSVVLLTLREHFIVHQLLVRIFHGKDSNCYQKMVFAAALMMNRTANSREYEWLRGRFSRMMSERLKGKPSKAKGAKWSEEARENRSENHEMRGRTYEDVYGIEMAKEQKELRRKYRAGKHIEEIFAGNSQALERMRTCGKYKRTPETRAKLAAYHRNRPASDSTKAKLSAYFSNPELNPNVDQTLYEFRHGVTGELVVSRAYDMKRNYGCVLMHRMLRDTTKSSRGWYFTGNIAKKGM